MNDAELSNLAVYVVHRAEVQAGDLMFVRVPPATPKAQAEALRHHLERNLPRAVRVVVIAVESLDVTFGGPDWARQAIDVQNARLVALERENRQLAEVVRQLDQRYPEPKRHVGDHSLDAADEVPVSFGEGYCQNYHCAKDCDLPHLGDQPDATYVLTGPPVNLVEPGPLLPQPLVVKTRPICGKEVSRIGFYEAARCLRQPNHEGDCAPEDPWPTT